MLSFLLRAPLWLRPSDDDRERALATLKRHYSEGRISTNELEARVESTLRPRSGAHLGLNVLELLARALGLVLSWRIRRLQRLLIRGHLAAYATVNAVAVGIWAIAGAGGFWPAWVLVPSTALLAWHAFASRRLTRALRRRGL